MYEFKFISASNASVKDIKLSREKMVTSLINQLGDVLSMAESAFNVVPSNKQADENVSEKELNEVIKQIEMELGDDKPEIEQIEMDLNSEEFYQNDYSVEADENVADGSAGGVDDFNLDALADLDPEIAETIKNYKNTIDYLMGGFNVVIDIDKTPLEEINFSRVSALIRKAKSLDLPLNMFVSGFSQFGKEKDHIPMLFDQKTMDTLIGLNNFLLDNKAAPLKFLEEPLYPEKAWTLDQVKVANYSIDHFISSIKMMNFSPFEAAAYIHQFVTSKFGYQENLSDQMSPRSLIGVMNSNDIVCVGYASLTKAIIDKLNMPGLEASMFESVIKPYNDDDTPVKFDNKFAPQGFGHIQNLIKIDDPKYNVKGYYVTDACWDCKDEQCPDGKGFGCFMFPVGDVLNFKSQFIQTNFEDEYDLLKKLETDEKYDPQEFELIKKYAKHSKPIPETSYEKVIRTVYRRLFPTMSKSDINIMVEGAMDNSIITACSIFNENATGSLAQAGFELGIEQMDASEIMK